MFSLLARASIYNLSKYFKSSRAGPGIFCDNCFNTIVADTIRNQGIDYTELTGPRYPGHRSNNKKSVFSDIGISL